MDLSMELKKGTILQGGKYKIEKKLGQGSFGITYLATAKFTTDSGLGKMDVVAKVCIKEFFMSEVNSRKEDGSTIEGSTGSVFTNYRHKFRKEAENLAKLSHSNIVRVFDVFDENGTTYYAMEYVDGENLDDYIKTYHPLNEDEAVGIFLEICQALKFMHERQMLHLDLKPKNIMRSKEGLIYLIDFGLSKQFTENGEPESSTSIGQGTPGYAPLEQAKLIKDGFFPATLDIYALGATMYKVLTGSRPLEASDILNEGFAKEQLVNNNRSETLIGIVEKCMFPMKKDRYQTISEIFDALPIFEPHGSLENDIILDVEETTAITQSEKRIKKKSTASSNKDSSLKVTEPSENIHYTNFKVIPTAITLRFHGNDGKWCVLHIGQRAIYGEYDRFFKSIGTKKISERDYIELIKKLDNIISKHRIEMSDCISHHNLSIWYKQTKKVDYLILTEVAFSQLCDLVPFNKQYRLYRFSNNNTATNSADMCCEDFDKSSSTMNKVCRIWMWITCFCYFLPAFVGLLMGIFSGEPEMLPSGIYSIVLLISTLGLLSYRKALWYIPLVTAILMCILNLVFGSPDTGYINGMPYRMLAIYTTPYLVTLSLLFLKKGGRSGWSLIK